MKKTKEKKQDSSSGRLLVVLGITAIAIIILFLTPRQVVEHHANSAARQLLPKPVIQQSFKPYQQPAVVNPPLIKNFELKKIDIGVRLRKPTDLAITRDGALMLIADSGAQVIYLLAREKEDKYKLKSKIYMDENRNAIADFLGWHWKKSEPIYLYCDFNERIKTIYCLDGDYGIVKEFHYDGSYILTAFDSPTLIKARSLRFSRDLDIAGISMPMQNTVITFGSNNTITDNYATTPGSGLGRYHSLVL